VHTLPLCYSDGRDVMNGHRLRVFSLQYHPNEPHLMVSGGWDDTVQVMNGTYSMLNLGVGVITICMGVCESWLATSTP